MKIISFEVFTLNVLKIKLQINLFYISTMLNVIRKTSSMSFSKKKKKL